MLSPFEVYADPIYLILSAYPPFISPERLLISLLSEVVIAELGYPVSLTIYHASYPFV